MHTEPWSSKPRSPNRVVPPPIRRSTDVERASPTRRNHIHPPPPPPQKIPRLIMPTITQERTFMKTNWKIPKDLFRLSKELLEELKEAKPGKHFHLSGNDLKILGPGRGWRIP